MLDPGAKVTQLSVPRFGKWAGSGKIPTVSQLFPLPLPADPRSPAQLPPITDRMAQVDWPSASVPLPRLEWGGEALAERSVARPARLEVGRRRRPAELPKRPATHSQLSAQRRRQRQRQRRRQRSTVNLAPWMLDSRWTVSALRISLGLVFLFFGLLKFVPGASPAEDLVKQTLSTLTFGAVAGQPAVFLTAALESFIGITLLTQKFLRSGLVVLAGSFIGILSPIFLFFSELFPGYPTIVGQYIIKDIVLVAAGLAVAVDELSENN